MKYIIFFTLFFCFFSVVAQTEGELQVTVTTSKTGGEFAPKNIVAIWIENNSGNFVKTLLAYGNKRKTYLNNWQEATSNAGVEFDITDAITGATQSNHNTRSCIWDGKDFKGNLTDDGQYKLCMELTDKNATGNYSSFDFKKDTIEEVLNPGNVSSFSAIQINWIPVIKATADNFYLNKKYSVYPTSTSGMIQITGDDIEKIEITDSIGRIVYQGVSTNIDMSNQNKGIYLVRIQTPNHTVVKKISKQ